MGEMIDKIIEILDGKTARRVILYFLAFAAAYFAICILFRIAQ